MLSSLVVERHQSSRAVGFSVGLAVVVGSVVALTVAIADPAAGWSDGARWIIYMLAAAAVAAIAGLIFGLPQARADFSPEASERYKPNSNLEQISDWLTKLLVGAGLVELKDISSHLRSAGAYLGDGLAVSNPGAYAVSAVVYGAGAGFGFSYLWTRLRMRLLLEISDKDAAEASRREKIFRSLQSAPRSTADERESVETLAAAADEVIAVSKSAERQRFAPVLWVDDFPANNVAIVEALQLVGIDVDTAVSTTQAMELFTTRNYGLVITDVGRVENGTEDDVAGLHLIEAVRGMGSDVPIVVFTSRRGLSHEPDLLAAGALMVTNRTSRVLTATVRILTTSMR